MAGAPSTTAATAATAPAVLTKSRRVRSASSGIVDSGKRNFHPIVSCGLAASPLLRPAAGGSFRQRSLSIGDRTRWKRSHASSFWRLRLASSVSTEPRAPKQGGLSPPDARFCLGVDFTRYEQSPVRLLYPAPLDTQRAGAPGPDGGTSGAAGGCHSGSSGMHSLIRERARGRDDCRS